MTTTFSERPAVKDLIAAVDARVSEHRRAGHIVRWSEACIELSKERGPEWLATYMRERAAFQGGR